MTKRPLDPAQCMTHADLIVAQSIFGGKPTAWLRNEVKNIDAEIAKLNAKANGGGIDGEDAQKMTKLNAQRFAIASIILPERQRHAGAGLDGEFAGPMSSPSQDAEAVLARNDGSFANMADKTKWNSPAVDAAVFDGGAVAALFQTSDGVPRDVRRGDEIGLAANVLRPRVLSLFGGGKETDQGAVKFLRETVNSHANLVPQETAEGAAEAEMDMSYADTTVAMATIRADIPVTNEQLEDVPQARDILDNRLIARARARLDRQITEGDGTGADIAGLANQAGQTRMFTSKATGPDFGQVLAAIGHAVRLSENSGDYTANGIVLQSEVHTDMLLAQTNGIYTLGGPAIIPSNTLWGIPVARTPHLKSGKVDAEVVGIVGDFALGGDVWYRKAATVELGLSDDDYKKYQTRFRVVLRALLAVYAPHAFVKLQADI